MKYVYVFVRMNMLPVQVAVQAAHAALQVGAVEKLTNTPYLLLFGTETEADLHVIKNMGKYHNIKIHEFIEPDMNNSLTAFGFVLDADSKKRDHFKECKLLPPFIHKR